MEKFRKLCKITRSGEWVTPTTEYYKQVFRSLPIIPFELEDQKHLIHKWKPFIEDLDSELHIRAVEIFETEAKALNNLSEDERILIFNSGSLLKYLFHSIKLGLKDLLNTKSLLAPDCSPCGGMFGRHKIGCPVTRK